MKTTTIRIFAVLAAAIFILPLHEAAGQGSPKYIYLTFDDGPLKGSRKIDSVVLAEQVKVSVFIVGEVMAKSPLLQSYFKLYEENPYIEIYNHSFSHAGGNYVSYYKNPQGVVEDIIKNETEYDLPYKIVRLPGANNWRVGERKLDVSKTPAKAADLLAAKGYKIFGWDLEWRHDDTGDSIQSVDEMIREIERSFETGKMFTAGHLVILIHDEMFRRDWEKNELRELIDDLKDRGYIFEHLRNYPEKQVM